MTLKVSCWSSNPPAAPCDLDLTVAEGIEPFVLGGLFILFALLIFLWRPRG
jgi:hypothetical protein